MRPWTGGALQAGPMALSGIWAGGTRWGWCCHSIATAGGCCEVWSGKIFWGNILLVRGFSLVWLLQGLGHPRNLGHLRGPGHLLIQE